MNKELVNLQLWSGTRDKLKDLAKAEGVSMKKYIDMIIKNKAVK